MSYHFVVRFKGSNTQSSRTAETNPSPSQRPRAETQSPRKQTQLMQDSDDDMALPTVNTRSKGKAKSTDDGAEDKPTKGLKAATAVNASQLDLPRNLDSSNSQTGPPYPLRETFKGDRSLGENSRRAGV